MEVFFTQKDGNLYAISPVWPSQELIIRNLNINESSKVELLTTHQKLVWKNNGPDLVIKMPTFDPNKFMEEDYYCFVYKISGI